MAAPELTVVGGTGRGEGARPLLHIEESLVENVHGARDLVSMMQTHQECPALFRQVLLLVERQLTGSLTDIGQLRAALR